MRIPTFTLSVTASLKRTRFYFAMNYKSKRWQRLRARVLKRDDYMCQWSKRFGRRVEADTVHHVFPAEIYPEYQWCEWNLVSLARDVHNAMHDRDSHELTADGKKLQEIICRKKNIYPRPSRRDD